MNQILREENSEIANYDYCQENDTEPKKTITKIRKISIGRFCDQCGKLLYSHDESYMDGEFSYSNERKKTNDYFINDRFLRCSKDAVNIEIYGYQFNYSMHEKIFCQSCLQEIVKTDLAELLINKYGFQKG